MWLNLGIQTIRLLYELPINQIKLLRLDQVMIAPYDISITLWLKEKEQHAPAQDTLDLEINVELIFLDG